VKTALCIGINTYPGNELSGCVNDAKDMAYTMKLRGYSARTLTDHDASREGIIAAVQQVVAAAQPGDDLFISYSGHGTYGSDASGDEPDHRDEAICPCPTSGWSYLFDDELYQLFSQRQPGVRLVFLSDSCHSGTVNTSRQFMPPVRGKARFLDPKIIWPQGAPHRDKARLVNEPVLLISGCKDTEYSYETDINGRVNGMLTRMAINTLKFRKPVTYEAWYREIRTKLPTSEFPQTPQFQASYEQRTWAI
jgi:hypothetical protein